ncbi:putative serine/threonine-protein kinase PBL9 [Heracleum sosnowskyi]|uniref:non-specific serine/threonine protein kinase n=1 Tax=Heracleum sosnowskyi TaxID=360622 RepID=A0AAD8HT14_9APIA|nr:putative serine/threonine-protein kinase PBL9 [Heracleum sosnowskyi]
MANTVGASEILRPSTSNNSKSFADKKYLWLGLIAASLFLLIGALIYVSIRNRFFRTCTQRLKQKKDDLDAEKLMLRRFQMEELVKATNNFSRGCLIGSGAFGNVYVGTFDVEGTLAIKKARADSYTSTDEFRNEVKLLSRVKHRNLVGLVGYCEEEGPKEAQVLVYEYVHNGSLLEYIVGRGGRFLTWRQRVNIAIGAAKGIAHLHEGINPSIIHRDIKPSNILVGEGFEAKVSDFGLVKSGPIGDQSHVSSQIKGTPGYLDPAYCSSLHLSPFSDVYSFGVILLQLIAARPAVDTAKNGSNYHIIQWARPSLEKGSVEDILDANLLLEPCNMEVMLKMGQLGLRCVVKVPKQRPTMTQVWQELEAALHVADTYIPKHPIKHRSIGVSHGSMAEQDDSEIGVEFQRFHVDMDTDHSASLRCLDSSAVSIEIDKVTSRGIRQQMSISMDEELSIPRD